MIYQTEKPRFLRPADDAAVAVKEAAGAVDVESGRLITYNCNLRLSLAEQRTRLPVFRVRTHLLYLLSNHQTLIVQGETGSGKSTQIPQYLVETGYAENNGCVVICQPRAAAVVALAERVAQERMQVCGEGVGYAVSFSTNYCQSTNIKYVTEGILLREMFSDPLLTQYSCIMLDEVHERSQLTDVLMGLIKKILKKRKNLKLVVSSATMDAEFLKNFFDINNDNKAKSIGKPNVSTSAILTVQGRVHPVEIFYVKDPVPDYIKATVETIIKIHENEPFGDILAFLTGQDEILSAVRILKEYSEKSNSPLLVLPLYGKLPAHDQLRALQAGPPKVRKVVVASNVAETSVTVPGVCYVVDSGFQKIRYFDHAGSLDTLILCPISQANATQRAGRAGRTTSGKCYRLYTEEWFGKLQPSIAPEMQRSDLSAVVLQLKALGIDNVLRFPFPSPPPARSLLSAIELLYALGAIDKKGQLTTPLGKNMAELPLRPALAKLLCVSGEFGCQEEILSIVAAAQMENIYIKGRGQEAIDMKIVKRNNFEVAEGDLLTLLNAYKAYSKKSSEMQASDCDRKLRAWCKKQGLESRALAKAAEIRQSLHKLVTYKFKLSDAPAAEMGAARTERILRCLCAGLFMSAAFLHPSGSYRSLSGHSSLYISPNSCMYNAQQPQWVLFSEVQSAPEKTFINNLVVIRKEWLAELAPQFYKEI